jgi:hypothetical protein
MEGTGNRHQENEAETASSSQRRSLKLQINVRGNRISSFDVLIFVWLKFLRWV